MSDPFAVMARKVTLSAAWVARAKSATRLIMPKNRERQLKGYYVWTDEDTTGEEKKIDAFYAAQVAFYRKKGPQDANTQVFCYPDASDHPNDSDLDDF